MQCNQTKHTGDYSCDIDVSPFLFHEPCGKKSGCDRLDVDPALNYLIQFSHASHLRMKVGMESYKH